MDNKRNFIELKDKYFETAKKRIEDLEKNTDADSLKEVKKLQWGLFKKELLDLEEYYLKWEPNGSNLSSKPQLPKNKKSKLNNNSKEEAKQSQEEKLRSCQEKVIELNEKEINELSFEDYLTVKNLKQKVASLLVDKNKVEEPFFKLRVEELNNSLKSLEKDYQDLSKEQVTNVPRKND
ncbi:14704_t:CDS:2, partial [Gigaspora margarita]